LPRPFAGILHVIGTWLDKVFTPLERWVHNLFHYLSMSLGIPGSYIWITLGVVVIAVATGVTAIYVRRSARLGVEALSPHASASTEVGNNPEKLERLALQAENVGDYSTAVRLRFRAGLTRLEQLGLVRQQAVRTSSNIAAAIHSPTFSRLAWMFDNIAYGGMLASAKDAREASSDWMLVQQEVSAAQTAAGAT
jgi:hypothetical protein